jgi:hypothetical protein
LQIRVVMQLIMCILQLQIGGVPRVLEHLQRTLANLYPNGPFDEVNQTHYPLNRMGIFFDIAEYIRMTWNFGSLGSDFSRQRGVCFPQITIVSFMLLCLRVRVLACRLRIVSGYHQRQCR